MTPFSVEAQRKMRARGILREGVHFRRRIIYAWSAIVDRIEGG